MGGDHDRREVAVQVFRTNATRGSGQPAPIYRRGQTLKGNRLNNRERQLWIDNDEGLYNWKRRSGLSMRLFIRQNRTEIDAAIHRALDVKPHRPDLGRPTY